MIAAFIFRRSCEVCSSHFTSRSGRARWCETCRPAAYRKSQSLVAAKLKRLAKAKAVGLRESTEPNQSTAAPATERKPAQERRTK